jgi:serine protease Do
MKSSLYKPFILLGVFILLVGLACNASSGTPAAEEVVSPTKESVATEEPTEPVQTEEAVSEAGSVAKLQDVKSAVVQIESQGTFVDPEFGLMMNAAGRGSGFIIDPSGIAVTNNHVVTGGALYKVWVQGEDEPRNARLLGVSECSDLAVIDIDGEGFPYLKLYEGPIDVGMDVYIAGFPLGDPEYTLTKGIISKAKAAGDTSWASVDSVLEYDAESNPGNSGGPVVTADGEVVAVHYASNSSADQAFGISRDVADSVVEQLRQGENVDTIGVNGQAVTSEDGSFSGIWVSSVQSGSPADNAGVLPGDIITLLENLVIASDGTMAEYCDVLRSHQPDDPLSIQVLRLGSDEWLEGHLNGEALEVTGSAGIAGGEESTSGGETTTESGDVVNPNASQSGDYYYYTEFDGSMDSWSYFLMNGRDEGFTAETVDSKLRVEINEEDTWVYFTFDDYIYTDTRIDTVVENLGRNTNNVSLICRASDDGWYEFNVYNSGEYDILWYDALVKGDYVTLYSGGSMAIKTGKAVNTYSAICSGDQLILGINGEEVRTISHKDLKEGLVGLGVSSFNVLPIIVEADNFIVSVP